MAAATYDELVHVSLTHLPQVVSMDSCAFFPIGDDQFQYLEVVSHQLDPAMFTQYKAFYEPFDIYKRAVFSVTPIPSIDRSSDYMDYTAWSMNPHRADFLLPNGLHHLAGIQITLDGLLLGDFSFHRDIGTDFSDLDMLVLRGMQSQLAYAYAARRRDAVNRTWEVRQQRARLHSMLSPREHEIAHLVSQGLSNPQIAMMLGISMNTVKTHVKHLMEKTASRNRAELVYTLYGEAALESSAPL